MYLTGLKNKAYDPQYWKVAPVMSQERWRNSRWRMFWILKSFYYVEVNFWGKTNYCDGVLEIYTEKLCEKKVFWVYMPFKLWLVTSLLFRHFKPNATSLEMEITWGVMKLSQSKPSRTTRNSVRELTFYSIPSGWRSKYTYPRIRAKGWLQIPLNFTMSDQKL